MAKSSKSAKSKIDTTVSDAVEVQSDGTATEVQEDLTDATMNEPAVEAEDQSDQLVEATADPDDAKMEADEVPLASEDGSAADNDAPSDPEPIVERPVPAQDRSSAGFIPLLLGGVAAGAIGYGIATYFPMNASAGDELSAQITAQADQIAALEAQIAAIPAPDMSALETQIADTADATRGQITDLSQILSDQLSALDARLLEVEKRPSADGTLSDTALAAYQRELEDLRADLEAQQANVMSAAAQAEADLAAAREEASQLEQAALAQAEAAAARAALNRVVAAVETGVPFADALADLDAADIPDALSAAAETGVATTSQLSEDFPAAARVALATARAEGVSDDAGGLGGFLRSQFDVRSTAPREGSGPDAVLSRAEAAVKEGRTADALAELEALPEVARAELTDWTARATQRADVLNAIATLSETYN